MNLQPFTHRTAARLALGALVAAMLGSGAGAALKPQQPELREPPTPQQIAVPAGELLALERRGGGWPARAPG